MLPACFRCDFLIFYLYFGYQCVAVLFFDLGRYCRRKNLLVSFSDYVR